MAIELATGYVSIVPSTRGFGTALNTSVSREMAGSGESAGRKFGAGFTAAAAGLAKGGGLALAAGAGFAAFKGIQVAANFEQTKIAFEGILGSAEKAQETLAELRDFAAKTPFEFTGLAESTQQLLGLGFGSEEVIPLMGTLGDVAAALGQGEPEIKGVVRALGQIKGKGKASAEELQQISEQLPGFSAISAIADDLGITTAEAFDQMAKGAIPADTAITAILDGMKNFPGAAGAMDRQSKTLNGVMSTFKDTLSGIAIDFITPYLPAISSAVASFSSFLTDTLIPGVQSFIDLFDREGIGGVLERLGAFISEQAPILADKLWNWIKEAGPPALEALAGFIGDVVTWILEEGLPLVAEGAKVLIPALIDWVTDDVIPGLFNTEDGAFWKMLAAFTEWVATEGVPAFVEGGKELGLGLATGIVEGIIDGLQGTLKMPPGAKLDLGPLGEIKIPELAHGGRVAAGMPYVVGDAGRPELFVPDSNGTVLPEVPGMGSGSLVQGDLIVQQLPGEDAGSAALRGLRKVRLMAAA